MRWADIERMPGAPSYRQMDTWTTAGLIRVDHSANPGSGVFRDWSAPMVTEAFRIKALSDLEMKLEVIRKVLSAPKSVDGQRTVELAPGVHLTVC